MDSQTTIVNNKIQAKMPNFLAVKEEKKRGILNVGS